LLAASSRIRRVRFPEAARQPARGEGHAASGGGAVITVDFVDGAAAMAFVAAVAGTFDLSASLGSRRSSLFCVGTLMNDRSFEATYRLSIGTERFERLARAVTRGLEVRV
jgi:cystathionine beta-lyase/cystathionine gamma-synthase